MFSRRKPPHPLTTCPNVLTPDKIPAFLIPPNLATIHGRRSQRNQSPVANEAQTCPEERHIIQVESYDQEAGRPASDTASSTETSPYGSPLPLRSLGGTLTRPVHGHRRRFTFCSPKLKAGLRPKSLSTEETSSTDTSPSVQRRETEPSWGSPASLSPLTIFPLDFIHCHERLTKEMMLTTSKGGCLRLSMEYLLPQRRVRVRLVSAEGFYQPHSDPRHISCCVSLSLRPGCVQRQHSALIKRSRNPIFNEDFFFEGVLLEELPRQSLRVKVVNKGSGVRRDVVLGKWEAPLDSLLPP
ncbi:UNVERIFIED_CONTAM: hypothetical protein K2H54_026449 [Gekko kuhli]